MCSIFGSYDKTIISELALLNASRGTLSHSIALFNEVGSLEQLIRATGPLLEIPDWNGYILCHQQAPTTQELDTIHPSNYRDNLLWHNGIIKEGYLKMLIDSSRDTNEWDTHHLNRIISIEGLDGLSNIRGSFTCIRYDTTRTLSMFRNHISPMFIDGANISSVPFSSNSKPIDVNHEYIHDFTTKTWIKGREFINIETPFFYFD